ncbi:hypothetical protein HN011_000556 [Eciton burchellii]|nr:hypothetical protein HN011_000556 [Eciton burchellii]
MQYRAIVGHTQLHTPMLDHSRSYLDILRHTRLYSDILSHTGLYSAIVGYHRSCLVARHPTHPCVVILNHVGLYFAMLIHSRLYSIILGFTVSWNYLAKHSNTRPYWAILGFAWLYLDLLSGRSFKKFANNRGSISVRRD